LIHLSLTPQAAVSNIGGLFAREAGWKKARKC